MSATAMTRVFSAVGRYVADHRPREAIANTVALIIVSNQPFYPLYLAWAVSPVIAPALLTFLSTPFFAAVPAVMRRQSLAGRCLLLAAGIGNTLLCRGVFGDGAGVEAFLFPCLALAAPLFRREESGYAALFAAASFGAYLLPLEGLWEPMHRYTPDEYAAFRRLNFLSAASLTAVIGWLVARRLVDNSAPDETAGENRA